MLEYIKPIFVILEVIFIFNLLIVVHELGHFWAAKKRGLIIEKFGIWFGKPLWKRTYNNIEYSLGSFPLGGFVALPQMASMNKIEGDTKNQSYPPITSLDKIIVALAGPLASLSLALVFATIVWIIGRPVSTAECTTTVGYVLEDGPGAKAGILPGDKIISVDGYTVHKFLGIGSDSVMWRIVSSTTETLPMVVERNGKQLTLTVAPSREVRPIYQRRALKDILVAPADDTIVEAVVKNGVADRAGIKPKDKIIQVDNHVLYSKLELRPYIESTTPGKMIDLKILRNNQPITIKLVPELSEESKPRIGVVLDTDPEKVLIYPNPVSQITTSVTSVYDTLTALVSGKTDIGIQQLSGPAGIMHVYYKLLGSDTVSKNQTSHWSKLMAYLSDTWRKVLWFSVIINVNLAIMNLIPIPILDGGHIALAIIEYVTGRKANIKYMQLIQTGCVIMVLTFVVYVTFFDLQDFAFVAHLFNK